jgi:hypothetical protein
MYQVKANKFNIRMIIKSGKKAIINFLLKKILKNVINITHDNFNTQMSIIKNKCKQIIKKYLKQRICIQFQ